MRPCARLRVANILLVVGVVATLPIIAAAPARAATGISFVQGTAFGTGTQVTSTTVQLTAPVAAGDLLVGWFSQYKVAGNVTVSDNVNGAWTRSSAALPFGSSGDNALYYLQGSAASAAGITITVSAPAAAYLQGTLAEYRGVAATGALDVAATGTGVGTAAQTSTTSSTPAGDLVYSALVTGGSAGGEAPGTSAGVRYTARNALASGGAYEQDITSGAAGTQVGAATLSKSTDWYSVVAAFRPAGTGTTPEPPSAPTGLTQTSATAAQVQLSWTASTDNVPITGYTVYRDGTKIGTSDATSYTDDTVAASTTYSYTVSATNSAGQDSPKSTPLSVTTPAGAGTCSPAGLVAAVTAANGQAGGGHVTLQSGCVYTLTAADNAAEGGNGLPVITGNVTIDGNGATIERSADSGTPHFRILDVAAGATVSIHDLTLRNGIADNGHDGGGAIWNHGNLSISGSTFDNNSNPATTGTSGGAIQNSGTLTVTRCAFTNNTAMEGGGVFNQSTATIRQSTFTNNAATVYGGGAILNAFGTTTVVGSTFTGNSGPGGGVIDNDTTVIVSDSTMYGNTGGTHGGGAIQNFGTVKLTTSTIAGNSSPYGANLYNYGSSTLTVSDSVITGGVSGTNCGGTSITDAGNNLDSGSSCGFRSANNSLSGVDPQLQPAAANGGPTRTMALTPGSPAIDVIPAADTGCTGTTDQRGTARPQGSKCDVGAYELVSTSGGDTQAPSTPTGLTASATDPGAVTLTWKPSTDNVGVAGYTIYRNGTALGNTPGDVLTYTDTTAAATTTYTYTVSAADAAGNRSQQSAPLSVTTSNAPLPAPSRVQGAVAGTGSKVTSETLRLSAPVAAGDLLIGWFGQYDSTGQVQVSDDVNGAWTRAPGSTSFSNGKGDIALYYVENAVAAPSGVTVTVGSSAATYLQAVVAEYSSVPKTAAVDNVLITKGVSASADSGPTASASPGDLLFSALMTGGSPGGATLPAGWRVYDHTGSYSIDDADLPITASGPQRATWTLAKAVDWYEVAAVVHNAAG